VKISSLFTDEYPRQEFQVVKATNAIMEARINPAVGDNDYRQAEIEGPASMKNLTIELKNHPGALAGMGQVLGAAGISIEGGGAFVVDGKGAANFLFEDGTAARHALEAAGIRVLQERDVVLQRLDQDQPGQLGKLLRRMADAGVNVEVQYSDHNHQLVLVVDDIDAGRRVSEAWTQEREAAPQTRVKSHHYEVQVRWTGSNGVGTQTYISYQRDHVIEAKGKPPIEGSSDPAFRGDAKRYNPEELLVASLSSCHMLWYLHLCAVNSVVVVGYEDTASGVMEEKRTGAAFVRVNLNPLVTITANSDPDRAAALHEEAHHNCYIANSVNFPVEVTPRVVEKQILV
jgi:organic hydroperoxide reductase OsmC/OhrA